MNKITNSATTLPRICMVKIVTRLMPSPVP